MDVFVARQPIFDRRLNIFAYELLFRGGSENNHYDGSSGDLATASVIADSLFVIGLEHLTNDKKAFINFTENTLKRDDIKILPTDKVVVEMLETVEPTQANLQLCKELKAAGFLLALDDFVFAPEFAPFIEIADIIKIDFLNSPPDYIQDIIERYANHKLQFLAEKVETYEQFEHALKLGYSLFQGYFFSKPAIMKGHDIPAHKSTYLKLLSEINRIDYELEDLEAVIQRDVALSYKLLKFINSAAFGFRASIRSIRQTLLLVGKKEISKWLSLLITRTIAEDKPSEIMTSCGVRARFGELIALELNLKDRASDVFLLGLFSRIDALLDQPLSEVIQELPLAEDIKAALLGEENTFGLILKTVNAYEKGNWIEYDNYIARLGNIRSSMPALYMEALKWVRNTSV